MKYWTIVNNRMEFSNACVTPKGIALRAHHGPRLLQTDCDSVEKVLEKHVGKAYQPHFFELSSLEQGKYYPRIFREKLNSPRQELPDPKFIYRKERASSYQSARNIFVTLREMFRFIEPNNRNKDVFGDQLRSLLILACTEVESAWRSVLIANNGSSSSDRLSTKNYVLLLVPMRLNEWGVLLSGYPEYGVVTPFQTWDPKAATESLTWYDAYNKVKHDREGNLHNATLQHVLSAMCAVYVMLAAQFGVTPLYGADPISGDLLINNTPHWKLSEYYIPQLVDGGYGIWQEQPYF